MVDNVQFTPFMGIVPDDEGLPQTLVSHLPTGGWAAWARTRENVYVLYRNGKRSGMKPFLAPGNPEHHAQELFLWSLKYSPDGVLTGIATRTDDGPCPVGVRIFEDDLELPLNPLARVHFDRTMYGPPNSRQVIYYVTSHDGQSGVVVNRRLIPYQSIHEVKFAPTSGRSAVLLGDKDETVPGGFQYRLILDGVLPGTKLGGEGIYRTDCGFLEWDLEGQGVVVCTCDGRVFYVTNSAVETPKPIAVNVHAKNVCFVSPKCVRIAGNRIHRGDLGRDGMELGDPGMFEVII